MMHALLGRGARRGLEPLIGICPRSPRGVQLSARAQAARNGTCRRFSSRPNLSFAAVNSKTSSTTGTRANAGSTTAPKPARTAASRPTSTSSPSSPSQPSPNSASNGTSTASPPERSDLTQGFDDALPEQPYTPPPNTDPLPTTENSDPASPFLAPSGAAPSGTHDWTRSYHGLSTAPFAREAADILLAPVAAADVEIKPDGIIYLPEIKYRRVLNRAFGPGGWGLAPRGETIVTARMVTREFGLVVNGRLVSVARGEQQYFDPEGIPTASEGCKSNALIRCCKDLGVASELWDPVFVRDFLKEWDREVWVEHVVTKKKRKIHVKKGVNVPYPYKEVKGP